MLGRKAGQIDMANGAIKSSYLLWWFSSGSVIEVQATRNHAIWLEGCSHHGWIPSDEQVAVKASASNPDNLRFA
jgi:hypothetical protein